MHHMFKTEQWVKRWYGDQRLLRNEICHRVSPGHQTPWKSQGSGQGLDRHRGVVGEDLKMQCNWTQLSCLKVLKISTNSFFPLFFPSLPNPLPVWAFICLASPQALCLSDQFVEFLGPVSFTSFSSLGSLMSVKWGGSSTPNFCCKWCLSAHPCTNPKLPPFPVCCSSSGESPRS